MGNTYLFLYNLVSCLGWGYCFFLTVQTALKGGGNEEVWKTTEIPLKVFLSTAVLEIAHSAMGLVRSPVLFTTMQVFTRFWIVWGIANLFPEQTTTQAVQLFKAGDVSVELSVTTLAAAWGISEVIRYAFFAAKEVGVDIYILKWLRYTAFIVLYPIGVGSELALVYLALPSLKASGVLNVEMPNAWNFAFNYSYVTCCYSLLYIPGFPQLYFYMLAQRKKVLGPQKDKAKAS